MRRVLATFFAVGAIVALWILIPLNVPRLIVDHYGEESISSLGAAGDIFGSAASLFAGIGSVGLLWVLYFDLRERRQSRTPLLVPKFSNQSSVLIRNAEKIKAENSKIDLEVYFDIENESTEAAFNLTVALDARTEVPKRAQGKKSNVLLPRDFCEVDNSPFTAGNTRKVIGRLVQSGHKPDLLLQRIARGECFYLAVVLSYQSVNQTKWESVIAFDVRGQEGDETWLGEIRDGKATVEPGGPLPTGRQPFLAVRSVPGGWSHRAV